jgi:anti-sigma regulatory factor (Ser/Thr protein kinase)
MTRGSRLPTARPGDHTVRFYGGDDELAAAVGGYLAEGIRQGDGVLVVATAPHRRMFEAALAGAGIDVVRERAAGRLLTEDAAELLGRFLTGGELDPERFQSVVSGLIGRAAAGGRPVRVYGEMVAVLWDAGHVSSAVKLEDLWNGLGARYRFALLCGYPSRVMSGTDNAEAVREVCQLHSAVVAADGGEPDDPGGPGGPVMATRSFPFELNSVRAARHFVTGLFNTEPDEMFTSDAAIVTTELASNAVLHARSGFTLTIFRSASAVRIAVRDKRPLVPGSNGLPFDIRTGHGLSVVSQIAHAWSVERLPDGKVIWAELPAS